MHKDEEENIAKKWKTDVCKKKLNVKHGPNAEKLEAVRVTYLTVRTIKYSNATSRNDIFHWLSSVLHCMETCK